MNTFRFLHISDLHLTGANGKASCRAEYLSYDIKMNLLEKLTEVIKKDNIKAVFISGDIETEKPEEFVSILDSWHENGAKTYIVFGCPGPHDTMDKREILSASTQHKSHVKVFKKTGFVNDDELKISVWGIDCSWNDEQFLKKFSQLKAPELKYPAIMLTHRPAIEERIDLLKAFGCNYHACGHDHRGRVRRLSSTQAMGVSGQIFSTWDGSGKAWPTGYIQGSIDNGRTDVKWNILPGRQTRRIWVDSFQKSGRLLRLGIDNAPKDKTSDILQYCSDGVWFCPNEYEHRFRGFIEPAQVVDAIKWILAVFPDDIFVTPSGAETMQRKYGHRRIAYTGKTLLSGDCDLFGNNVLLDEFIARSYKRHPFVK